MAYFLLLFSLLNEPEMIKGAAGSRRTTWLVCESTPLGIEVEAGKEQLELRERQERRAPLSLGSHLMDFPVSIQGDSLISGGSVLSPGCLSL